MIVVDDPAADALTLSPLTIRSLPVGRLRTRNDWDHFAQACLASYYCARAYIRPHRFTHRVHLFEVFAASEKVAQCAVAVSRVPGKAKGTFLDAIQLKPKHKARWADAMTAVLHLLGAGVYVYGSVWNAEEPRDEQLASLPGVTLISTEAWRVMSVDFADFGDWDHYHRSMSTNAKRNVAKAVKADPAIRIETQKGFPSAANLKQMISLRHDVFERKGLAIGSWRFTLLRRLVMLRQHISVSWVYFQNRCTAYALCLRWGDHLYYTDGASTQDNGGSAWFLLTQTLRAHYLACPKGKFVMGYDPAIRWSEDTTRWSNLLRQRQQCRARSTPTSIVVFRYEDQR
ncbi:hypothetical protein [Rhodopila sp.]|uniref:hypothetical protein n=1 Tax=Rhodopila sp. TaxID=2480087 RepID=UPI003D0E17AA